MRKEESPICLKHHAVSRWASRHLGGIAHERRVVEIASSLFDLTHHLHRLTSSDLRLLRMAAVVHDVGRSVDREAHPEHGARMVRRGRDLPLTGAERRGLAFLTRYHKGRVPPIGAERYLRQKDDPHRLRMILGLLRAADGLDGRMTETPRLRFALDGRKLHVYCCLEHNTAKARRIYTRRKKFRLLEEMLGCDVVVRLARPKQLRLVA